MSVAVQCPNCEGLSRVDHDAVGVLVACPGCGAAFVAVELRLLEPSLPRRQPRPPRRASSNDLEPAEFDAPVVSGGVPVSVLIGLALLPFLLPLLWLIAPFVLQRPPALSLAAPAALAAAASALCMAVVYTVDWTATTRIKGVLMLLGLTYFTGLSLYFLKHEMVMRFERFFGHDLNWNDFKPHAGDYTVQMPGHPSRDKKIRPLADWVRLECYTSTEETIEGKTIYVIGSGKDPFPDHDDMTWFREAKTVAEKACGGLLFAEEALQPRNRATGREWRVSTDKLDRRIRVLRQAGRVYYLAVDIEAGLGGADKFFNSLEPTSK